LSAFTKQKTVAAKSGKSVQVSSQSFAYQMNRMVAAKFEIQIKNYPIPLER
jgi:hypothetical protein